MKSAEAEYLRFKRILEKIRYFFPSIAWEIFHIFKPALTREGIILKFKTEKGGPGEDLQESYDQDTALCLCLKCFLIT